MGTLAGTTNALGWSTVLIYLFAAVGSGYFLMGRTSRLSHPQAGSQTWVPAFFLSPGEPRHALCRHILRWVI
jgi:hypothetical protein